MSEPDYIALSPNCTAPAAIGPPDLVEQHALASHNKHKFMKMEKLKDKCQQAQQKIDTATLKLIHLKHSFSHQLTQLANLVHRLRDGFLVKIDQKIQDYWGRQRIKKDESTSTLVKNQQFKQLTCSQVSHLIDVIQNISKDDRFVQRETEKVDKQAAQLLSELASTLPLQLEGQLKTFMKWIRQYPDIDTSQLISDRSQQICFSETISSIGKLSNSSIISKHTQIANLLDIKVDDSAQKQIQGSGESVKKNRVVQEPRKKKKVAGQDNKKSTEEHIKKSNEEHTKQSTDQNSKKRTELDTKKRVEQDNKQRVSQQTKKVEQQINKAEQESGRKVEQQSGKRVEVEEKSDRMRKIKDKNSTNSVINLSNSSANEIKRETSKNNIDNSSSQKSNSVVSNLKPIKKPKYKKELPKQEVKQQKPSPQLQKSNSGDLSSFLGSEYFQKESSHSTHSTHSIHSAKPFSKKEQSNTLSYGQRQDESDSSSQLDSQNESKLNQTIIQFKKEILNNDLSYEEGEKLTFHTVEQVERFKKVEVGFNIKVAIVRVLYYSVLESHIPKVKFIAGDQTGYGVFYTNYYPGLKVKTQIQMRQCKFRTYKGSDEIINPNTFRIMREYQPKITVNMKGVKLNKVITPDLYYPLQDKRCTLVRQLADILKSGKCKTYFVRRMTVQVVTVIKQQASGVLCVVGDSSGMMVAYLNKDTLKAIRKLDVVKLSNVRGIRGGCKHYYDPSEQIIFVDSSQKSAKVKLHLHDFLEVSEQMMTLN